MDSYSLSRNFFNWCFEHPEKIRSEHVAIFFFAMEHCNRLGGKEKFGFPSQMTMEAIGIKNHHTYYKYFNNLIDWGFIKLVQKSNNQYSANIISLINATSKKRQALDLAFIKHSTKHPTQHLPDSTPGSCHIDKQETRNNKTIKQETTSDLVFPFYSLDFMKVWNVLTKEKKWRKKSFSALQASLDQLSKHSEQVATQMIKNTIAGEWQGLFELKNQTNGKQPITQAGIEEELKKYSATHR